MLPSGAIPASSKVPTLTNSPSPGRFKLAAFRRPPSWHLLVLLRGTLQLPMLVAVCSTAGRKPSDSFQTGMGMVGMRVKGQRSPRCTPTLAEFFSQRSDPCRCCYEILRGFLRTGLSIAVVAEHIGCSRAAVYSISPEFGKPANPVTYFFCAPAPPSCRCRLHRQVVEPCERKRSVPDLKAYLDARRLDSFSQRSIVRVLQRARGPHLPRHARAICSATLSRAIRASATPQVSGGVRRSNSKRARRSHRLPVTSDPSQRHRPSRLSAHLHTEPPSRRLHSANQAGTDVRHCRTWGIPRLSCTVVQSHVRLDFRQENGES